MRALLKIFFTAKVVIFLPVFALSACHPWFRMGPGAPPGQIPVIMSQDGTVYVEGTPSWVLLIDQCMSNGGLRNECIENLPPEEKAMFEAWQQNRAGRRRILFENLSDQ